MPRRIFRRLFLFRFPPALRKVKELGLLRRFGNRRFCRRLRFRCGFIRRIVLPVFQFLFRRFFRFGVRLRRLAGFFHNELNAMAYRRIILKRYVFVARDIVFFTHGGEQFCLLYGIYAEVRLHVKVEFQHVFRIAGFFDYHGDYFFGYRRFRQLLRVRNFRFFIRRSRFFGRRRRFRWHMLFDAESVHYRLQFRVFIA